MQSGILKIYELKNIAEKGLKPLEKLVEVGKAYYEERTVGITRAYAAMSAKQHIDKLVRAFNTDMPVKAEYVILEDKNQYRISLKQMEGDAVDLTLERLEDYLDVIADAEKIKES